MSETDEQQKLYDISMVIEDLRNEHTNVRVAAMRRLKEIGRIGFGTQFKALVLGPQKTRDELFNYLFGRRDCEKTMILELIDSDDEVLVVMAEQMGNLFVGRMRSRRLPSSRRRIGVYRLHSGCVGEVVHNARGYSTRGGKNGRNVLRRRRSPF